MKARTILEGCGLGILVTITYIWPDFSPYHSGLYHSQIPVNRAAWGALIDVGVISALAVLLFAYLEKRGKGYRSLIWAVVSAGIVSRIVQIVILLTGKVVPEYLNNKLVFCFALAIGLLLYWLRPPAYLAVTKSFGVLLSLVGFCIIWIVPELVYQALLPLPTDSPVNPIKFSSGAVNPAAAAGNRIVWILFDELSYNQTFEHRFPGLAMPEFDRFKTESVLFSNVVPAGIHTEQVIPGLFLGRIVTNAQSDMRGSLSLEFAGQSGWHRFDPNATIFADAHRLGWSDGLVGWYNPYCRILPGVLDSCYWHIDGFLPQKTILEHALDPIKSELGIRQEIEDSRQDQKRSLLAIVSKAQTLVQDENIHFIFIHLPPPHPPGFFDRTTGQFRNGGTYIDNLALADKILGEMLNTLKATRSWSKTTLIVSSDHSWRVAIWKAKPGWTEEEETASRGKFDTRPMLMIRFPQQSHEVDVAQPFQGIEIHTMLEQMLQGKLQSPAELQGWLRDSSNAAPNSLPPAKLASGN